MFKKTLFALAASTFIAGSANAATIINLDGKANASKDGSNAVVLALAAGTYTATFTRTADNQDADYTAFSRWSSNTGCDSAGANCRQGWELSAGYKIGDTLTTFGDAGGTGNYGPTATPDDAFYASAEQVFAAGAGLYSATFTLASAGNVGFYIYDNNVGDNRGGISLSLTSAVPEPATWGLMIAGFGLIGMAARRRRRISVTYA
ncbi:MAG TPA: PEPxxWA-CTERM sorting domain-containing protein [Sphingomonadaceae bacterium]|nr:PEPxxWA-CTERM sorting domain-containing protein [Sphingomonadaceae bacterium]